MYSGIPFDPSPLLRAIDAIPALKGAGLAYVGHGACTVLRASRHSSGLNTFVVIRQITATNGTLNGSGLGVDGRSNLGTELLALGLNCGATVAWAFATVGASAATPFTGGSSGVLAYIGAAGTVAGALQCGNSVMRVYNEVVDPTRNDMLDDNAWYDRIVTALDILSLAGGVGAAKKTVQMVLTLRRTTGRSFMSILKGMSRAQRKQIARELANQGPEGPISNNQFKRLVRSGQAPKLFSQTVLNEGIRRRLLDGLSSALTGASSATSGTVKEFVIHVFQE